MWIGPDILGFIANEVATHSICTTFTTLLAYQMDGTRRIMMEGCWKSDTFMRYVRKDIIDIHITDNLLNIIN